MIPRIKQISKRVMASAIIKEIGKRVYIEGRKIYRNYVLTVRSPLMEGLQILKFADMADFQESARAISNFWRGRGYVVVSRI